MEQFIKLKQTIKKHDLKWKKKSNIETIFSSYMLTIIPFS